jgi:alpha-beta hydrolase superfamily lysophospholipase
MYMLVVNPVPRWVVSMGGVLVKKLMQLDMVAEVVLTSALLWVTSRVE